MRGNWQALTYNSGTCSQEHPWYAFRTEVCQRDWNTTISAGRNMVASWMETDPRGDWTRGDRKMDIDFGEGFSNSDGADMHSHLFNSFEEESHTADKRTLPWRPNVVLICSSSQSANTYTFNTHLNTWRHKRCLIELATSFQITKGLFKIEVLQSTNLLLWTLYSSTCSFIRQRVRATVRPVMYASFDGWIGSIQWWCERKVKHRDRTY